MSRDASRDDRRQAPPQRPEGSLLYSSGNWRPPGATLLPAPLNSLGRPGSAARPSWAAASRREGAPAATAGLPAGGARASPSLLNAAAKTIDESSLFRPLDVLENAFVNSATVEERAVERELQKQNLLFSDQPKASRPGLTAMLSYLTNNNAQAPAAAPAAGGHYTTSEYGGGSTAAGLYGGTGAGAGAFDVIPEEESASSLQYAYDSPLRPPSATTRSRSATLGGGGAYGSSSLSPHPLYSPPTYRQPSPRGQPPPPPPGGLVSNGGGSGGGGGGSSGGGGRGSPSEPWFGPPSTSIGKAERPPSARPRPGSAFGTPYVVSPSPVAVMATAAAAPPPPPPPGSRPVSALGAAAAATAGGALGATYERGTIERRLVALTGPAGTGRVRGQSPPGQWARVRQPTSGGGTAAAAAGSLSLPSVPSRPVSAPRSFGRIRPASAVPAGAATAAAKAQHRRASGTQVGEAAGRIGGAIFGGGAWRPLSAIHRAQPQPALGPGAAAATAATAGTADGPAAPSPAPRPQSPTRGPWMMTGGNAGSPGNGGSGSDGSPPRPSSAVPVALASVTAVAVGTTLVESVGKPPVPYRPRNEFLQPGKKIPTGCRPLSAFSTLSSASNRPGTARSTAAGSPRGGTAGGCVVPLADSVADQPVYQEVDGDIRTSYDVLAYFSAQGQNAQKKLFYMNARKPSDLLDVVSPFDLEVVPFERTDPVYWTMSALGVVRVEQQRAEEGEFTSLPEWMRLNTTYELLRKLRFYRLFLLCRTFGRWRANVKRTAFERTRGVVAQRLFAVSPTFQGTLLRAGRLVQAMRETAVVAITNRLDRLYSLEEFVGEQDNRRQGVAYPSLSDLVAELAAEVAAVGSRVDLERDRMDSLVDIAALRQSEFVTHIPRGPDGGSAAWGLTVDGEVAGVQGPRGGGPHPPGAGMEGAGGGGVPGSRKSKGAARAFRLGTVAGGGGSKGDSKSKSISAVKAEKAQIISQYDTWVAAQARMPAFVRLLDYLVACTAVDLGVRGTHELLSYLDNPAKTRGVLSVNVSFEPRNQIQPPQQQLSADAIAVLGGPADGGAAAYGFAFNPQRRQVHDGLTHVVGALVGMLADLPRPSSVKTLATNYVEPGEEFLDVSRVINEGTPLYRRLYDEIVAHVETSFDKALEYVRATFEDKRPIFEFARTWEAAAYDSHMVAAAIGLVGYDKVALTLRRDLSQQRRWQKQVDQMKMSNTVGILYVDSKRMRAALQDSIERIIEDLKASVMGAARRAVAVALETLRGWARDLEPRPTDLDGYARMRELYGNLMVDQETAFRVVQAASDMYELYREYGGRTEVKDAVALETLLEEGTLVRSQLGSLGEWVRERAPSMVSELGGAVQDLSSGVMGLLGDITAPALGDPEAEVLEMLDVLAALELRLLDVEEAAGRYKRYQELFGQPVDEPGNLPHLRREYEQRKGAWSSLADWVDRTSTWLTSPCASLDADAVVATVEEFARAAYKMARAARDDRVVVKLKEGIETFKRYSQLFSDACNPALQPHHWAQIWEVLGPRRGTREEDEQGQEGQEEGPNPDQSTTISELLELGALAKIEAISAISAAASKEQSLLKSLRTMQAEWEGAKFKMVPYKDTGTCVVGQTDEIQMQLDEQLMKIQAMNASPFVKPFAAEAAAWQATLEGLEELLESWLSCQGTWMYLEPIFSSPDIVKQMPEEGEKFAQVDLNFRLLVDEVVSSPGVIKLAEDADRRSSLALANRLLEEVQRGLSRYLEAKRLAFPRFFFLSNDEMLEILSETKDPTRVQPHLRKCFEGIHRLQFEPGTGGVVSAMISLEGEKVPFKQLIHTSRAKGKVEQWLQEVEAGMFESIHDITGRGIADYVVAAGGGGGPGAAPRSEWALRWPGMVVLLAAGVFWTRGVEGALAGGKLPVYEQQCSAELREIVDLVRGELTGLQRTTLGALVVMDVHARDVVAGLVSEGVADAADFGWQAQLRSYWQLTDGKPVAGQPARDFTALLCMMSASLEYGYEYLGNTTRLVITPLTDRCYRTLMGAIHLNLGGAPEGPAGTGKTETTKDLAKAMARQCVVFNCSDTLNHMDMAKFFKGLAAAGAWACFDEFNRIDLEVLSVVAQQVLDIQRAISARVTLFTFEGTDLPLKWSAWCAITMNPGYAGRTELPDNLKALFRSVAMMVPDYAMIAEIILYSYGYLAARPAAKKIVACYKLCSEQLSSQDHYDYGMRAVMAVLRAAGNLKRQLPAPSPEAQAALTPEQQEAEELGLVLRSLVDVNLCKFLSHDVPLFNGIVADLFPGISLPKTDYGPLATALRTACAAANLQPTEYFMTKATQLYEMILVRHGLMLVGLPFSGKTSSYRVLAAALTRLAEQGEQGGAPDNHTASDSGVGADDPDGPMGQSGSLDAAAAGSAAADGSSPTPVSSGGGTNPHGRQVRASAFVLNPKAVTMGQLYGQNDPASHEWTDGVLAVLFRRCAADPSPDRKWLVLDGPVDAIWIENMNTVLDDNKKLCLNSGEIIAMSPPMNLIFEVGDLAAASPATVSRCGMIYLEPAQLGTAPLLASWLATLPPHWGTPAPGPGTGPGGGLGLGLVGGAAASVLSVGIPGRLSSPGLSISMMVVGGEVLAGVKARLAALFEGLVVPTIRFVRREVKEGAPSLDGNLAATWMRLVGALMLPAIGTPEAYRKAGFEGRAMALADAVGLMALVWSVGCTAATQEGRALVDSFIRRALAGTLAGVMAPSGYRYDVGDAPSVPLLAPAAAPPERGLLYDYLYDTAAGSWVPWTSLILDTPPPAPGAPFNSLLVPTPDTAAVTYLLRTAINTKYPFLLVGPTGTGKSVTVVRCLLDLDPEAFAPPNIIGFSARTSANTTQALVDAKLDKRRRGMYGPGGARRGVVFVDDLNMPQREVYGAQPPIELLRQFMDHGGWYGRDNAFRNIQDVLLVAAMGPPGGGRDPVTSRFTRHFATLCLPEASCSTLAHIFGTLHGWFLAAGEFPEPVTALRDAIIGATLDVYGSSAAHLLPTPTKSHYTFNLRDCSRVVQGMQAQDAPALALSARLMLPLTAPSFPAASSAPVPLPDAVLAAAHLRLWVHEVLRVFYDRLVDSADQEWFLGLLRDLTQKHFAVQLDELLGHLATVKQQEQQEEEGGGSEAERAERGVTPDLLRRCLFGDYMTDDGDQEEGSRRPYLEIPRPSTAAVSRLEELQADYNGMGGAGRRRLQLAVFLYAVEHVTRIARVLRQEGGHVLCVGVGGSGRQSLARLAAFLGGMDTFQVELSRSYGLNEWRDDLRRLMRRAGADEKPTVFLFGDSQASQESFVEDVNSLLNSGEVPNIFPHDERAAICEAVRAAARRADPHGSDSPSALWSYFVSRCRTNLHVVLTFSPAGDAFRERLRRFPSLVNCCTIDWFHSWPDDALDAVATKLLMETQLAADLRRPVKDLCKLFHSQAADVSSQFLRDTGRPNYVTPTSYLELIGCFGSLLKQRTAKVLGQQHKYEMGLDKLAFTAEQVTVMRNELKALSPVLARTVTETEQLLSEIAREKETVVEPQRALVDREVKQADAAAAAARAIKEECGAILSEALPALEAATQALDTIKPADIRLVQTFKSPPAAVKLVMEAVCVLLDVKPTLLPDPNMAGKKIVDWWDASKRLLMDPQLIQRLKDYDRDNIAQRIIDKIRKEYTGDPEFTAANAAKASSAAEGLCKWVHAMDQYDRVAKVVAPKRAALAEAEAEYRAVLAGLQSKQGELRALEARLQGLETRLGESQERKARLEAETQACALKLDRAEQLLGGLGGERERWTAAGARLRSQLGGIAGDMLLAAGSVGYLGALTMPYRDRSLASWTAAVEAAGVQTSGRAAAGGAATFSLTTALGDPVTIREWVIAGLPNDSFSIDSAVIAANSRRWPLCIDPQGQANRWIKAMHTAQKIKVMKLTDPDYLRTLETAVSYGLPVLLENVGETLDPSLDPLLLKQTYRQGPTTVIRLGDNVVEYSPAFKLYLTTSLRNPHYLPETAVKVALLNFMITPEGLSDQLLGVAVAAEMPQLEDQRQTLVVTSAENARQLVEIEGRILAVLSATEGNILEDATAVHVLSEAKRLSDDISAKQAVAERTQTALDAARRRYRPIAELAAQLFFSIADLAVVDPMYQYSLAWFIGLFVRSIQASAAEVPGPAAAAATGSAPAGDGGGAPPRAVSGGLEGADLGARLAAIEKHFLYATYMNVARSVFESHKLLLSLLMASRLAAHRGRLPPDQLAFLVRGGGAAAAAAAASAPPAPAGIPPRAWYELQALAAMPGGMFSSLPYHVTNRLPEWESLVDCEEPQSRPLPDPVDGMLSSFARLLVLRCLRPDKLVPAVEGWVGGELGPAFVAPPPLDLAAAFAEAANVTVPLLFVLSPGTDPWATLLRFAEERGQASKLQVISLGQGQGPRAEALLEAARRMGSWVVLQNCHLAPSWMPSLERIWEGIREDNTDGGFRLWLTSRPTPAFPSTLLQAAVKMTAEPPAGLGANMRRSLALEPLSDHLFWELASVPHNAVVQPSSVPHGGGGSTSGRRGGGNRRGSQADGVGRRTTSDSPVNGGGSEDGSANGPDLSLKRLLFGLVFLHAAVQERKRYGPMGWNVPYGFDDGDLRISARQLRMYVQDTASRGQPVPYEALRYAIGECNYGGRVTDDKDRLLLGTILRRIIAPETAQQPGAVLLASGGAEGAEEGDEGSDDGTGGGPLGPLGRAFRVVVPEATSVEGFCKYVDSIPTTIMPDVFGLHLNADISKDLATTDELLSNLANACGGGGGGGGGGRGAASTSAATAAAAAEIVRDVLSRLPPDFDLEAVAAAYPVLYHQSMNQVLVQELSRYNRLTGLLRSSLGALGRAVAGLAVLSEELEGVLGAVAAGRVPQSWKAASYPSLKPLGSYVSDLLARLAFLRGWAEGGPPAAFWVGAFFFPPAFTTAVLQNFARHHGVPIDAVGFDFEILRVPDVSALNAPPPAGVFIHGLHLEGAAWDRRGGCLAEQPPKQLYAPAPPMWFKPVKMADLRPSPCYDCPVYRTAERRGVLATTGHSTNFLMTVRLPLGAPPRLDAPALRRRTDHWVLRGVCMLVSLSE